jgi:hypothetical protein
MNQWSGERFEDSAAHRPAGRWRHAIVEAHCTVSQGPIARTCQPMRSRSAPSGSSSSPARDPPIWVGRFGYACIVQKNAAASIRNLTIYVAMAYDIFTARAVMHFIHAMHKGSAMSNVDNWTGFFAPDRSTATPPASCLYLNFSIVHRLRREARGNFPGGKKCPQQDRRSRSTHCRRVSNTGCADSRAIFS